MTQKLKNRLKNLFRGIIIVNAILIMVLHFSGIGYMHANLFLVCAGISIASLSGLLIVMAIAPDVISVPSRFQTNESVLISGLNEVYKVLEIIKASTGNNYTYKIQDSAGNVKYQEENSLSPAPEPEVGMTIHI